MFGVVVEPWKRIAKHFLMTFSTEERSDKKILQGCLRWDSELRRAIKVKRVFVSFYLSEKRQLPGPA